MKNGESLRNRVVRHFFNISGDFDEYKQQEANRIGTNALMLCIPALLLPPTIAALWAVNSPEAALLGLILFDVIFVMVIVTPYLAFASRRAHLTDHEVAASDLHTARKQVVQKAVGYALYFMVVMYVIQVLGDTVFDGANIWQELIAIGNIRQAIYSGIFFGIIMGISYWVRLKKQE